MAEGRKEQKRRLKARYFMLCWREERNREKSFRLVKIFVGLKNICGGPDGYGANTCTFIGTTSQLWIGPLSEYYFKFIIRPKM